MIVYNRSHAIQEDHTPDMNVSMPQHEKENLQMAVHEVQSSVPVTEVIDDALCSLCNKRTYLPLVRMSCEDSKIDVYTCKYPPQILMDHLRWYMIKYFAKRQGFYTKLFENYDLIDKIWIKMSKKSNLNSKFLTNRPPLGNFSLH